MKERGGVAGGIPVTVPRIGRRFLVVAGVVAGVLAGWLAFVLTTGREDVARVQEIKRTRAEAMVDAYEAMRARVQPSETRIAVTGTGPGLALVADLQRTWAENAVMGTGPGLEHLPTPVGEEVALVGAP